jgi:hypothetical protein
MIKWIPLLATLLISKVLFAQPKTGPTLLKCLGEEEKRYHEKKRSGPKVELNKRLIEELVQLGGIEAKPEILQAICGAKRATSLRFLERLLEKPKSWYVLKPDSALDASVTAAMVDEFNATGLELLTQYIAQLQIKSPTPKCLETKIPEIATLHQKIKWIQEEQTEDLKIVRKKALEKLFKKMKGYRKLFKECADEAQALKKEAEASEKSSGK